MKNLLILVIFTAALLGGAWWFFSSQTPSASSNPGPQLDRAREKIQDVEKAQNEALQKLESLNESR